MKMNIKNKLLPYLMFFVMIMSMLFGIKQCVNKNKSNKVLKGYKSSLIETQSLLKVSEGHYRSLVDDLNTKSSLLKEIKGNNKKLYKSLREGGKSPISYSVIQAQPLTKIDTVIITDTIRDGISSRYFIDYYPNKSEAFISYLGKVEDKGVTGIWTFKDISMGLVLTEKSKGVFEVDTDVPQWLTVKDIKVNTLPLKNIRPDNFDWVLGSSIGIDLDDDSPVLDIEGGFRIKKSIFTIGANTNRELKAGIKFLF